MTKKTIIITGICVSLFLTGTVSMAMYFTYKIIFGNNISSDAAPYLYVKTGSTYDDVLELLQKENIVKSVKTFQTVARFKKYPQKVKSGRYPIKQGMSNNELINMLRLGHQEAVHFTFNNIRTKEQFAQKVSQQLEIDYDSLLSLLNNDTQLEKYHLNKDNVLTVFIPNTYQLWWNTSAKEFVERMYREYQKFWNKERLKKAADMDLSPTEIIILASIVEEENHRSDEQSKIAGVYINRLKKDMYLQADPTVKYALQDFGRKRLLYVDLEVNSPYNTYKYTGLPPGTIRIPSPNCIDNVLNYEKHYYLFMCAKEDFSGYHNFSRTATEHNVNVNKYHKALNRNKIKK
ncbi:MAG: endolytic transglycosylase MltG [Bacteroidales bacterium]|jgi:UPF0755 protein|nr:endolytic transglycosylase MltG [Bacteroidales bacterium]